MNPYENRTIVVCHRKEIVRLEDTISLQLPYDDRRPNVNGALMESATFQKGRVEKWAFISISFVSFGMFLRLSSHFHLVDRTSLWSKLFKNNVDG